MMNPQTREEPSDVGTGDNIIGASALSLADREIYIKARHGELSLAEMGSAFLNWQTSSGFNSELLEMFINRFSGMGVGVGASDVCVSDSDIAQVMPNAIEAIEQHLQNAVGLLRRVNVQALGLNHPESQHAISEVGNSLIVLVFLGHVPSEKVQDMLGNQAFQSAGHYLLAKLSHFCRLGQLPNSVKSRAEEFLHLNYPDQARFYLSKK